jgi:quinol monooxygenase YgiN
VKVMIALFSRWKLKAGYPQELADDVQALVNAVRESEPGALVFSVSVPAPHPPIGPPPEYAVHDDPSLARPVPASHLLFFEVYSDAEAFSRHLRGAAGEFLKRNAHFFDTPWQGHPRPEVTYLDPQSLLVREALGARSPTHPATGS